MFRTKKLRKNEAMLPSPGGKGKEEEKMLESMELRKTEGLLKQMARKVPVNYELKAELLKKFSPGKARLLSWKRITVAISVCVLLLFFSYWAVTNNLFGISHQPVLAANLKVVNQVSFMDLASGDFGPPVVGKDCLYLPIPGQGTLRLPLGETNDDARLITGPDLLFAALSHDGRTAATLNSQGIKLYDLETGSTKWLIWENSWGDYQVFYEFPSFAPDDKSLLVTRKVERRLPLSQSHEISSIDIFEISIDGSKNRKLFSGSCASFTPDGKKIVFEREGKIMVHDVESGREEVIDEGRYPAVSPDGLLVAYFKVQSGSSEPKTLIFTPITDVWICSLSDYSDKRQITHNWSSEVVSSWESHSIAITGDYGKAVWYWVTPGTSSPFETLPGTPSLFEVSSFEILCAPGSTFIYSEYDYHNPVWGNTSSTLFVLKESETSAKRLVRIDLARQPLSPEDTVLRWIGAISNRDFDSPFAQVRPVVIGSYPLPTSTTTTISQINTYAISYPLPTPTTTTISQIPLHTISPSQVNLPQENLPPNLHGSYPRPIAYAITSSGEENGKFYVDLAVVEAYVADSYFSILEKRVYLDKEGDEYRVSRWEKVKRLKLVGKEDGIHLIEEDKDQVLLSSQKYLAETQSSTMRLSSTAISYDRKYLFYTLQKDNGFRVFIQDLEKGCQVGSIQVAEDEPFSARAANISLDSDGHFAAIRYLIHSKENYGAAIASKILLYDLKQQKLVNDPWISPGISSQWSEGNLLVTGSQSEGNHSEEVCDAWWASDKLIVEKRVPGGSLRWAYNPETQTRRLQGDQP
jgi:hypothetical protein